MNRQPHFCQSCSMPLVDTNLYGTNADGSRNAEYCMYCFQDGEFTSDTDMEGMINLCLGHLLKAHPEMSPESAEKMLREHLPQLKRWAK